MCTLGTAGWQTVQLHLGSLFEGRLFRESSDEAKKRLGTLSDEHQGWETMVSPPNGQMV